MAKICTRAKWPVMYTNCKINFAYITVANFATARLNMELGGEMRKMLGRFERGSHDLNGRWILQW